MGVCNVGTRYIDIANVSHCLNDTKFCLLKIFEMLAFKMVQKNFRSQNLCHLDDTTLDTFGNSKVCVRTYSNLQCNFMH